MTARHHHRFIGHETRSVHTVLQHLLQTFGQELAHFRLAKQKAADKPVMLLAGERFGRLPFLGFRIAATGTDFDLFGSGRTARLVMAQASSATNASAASFDEAGFCPVISLQKMPSVTF